jgi:hypothetical protein
LSPSREIALPSPLGTGQARVMSIRIQALAIDAHDTAAQARFWAEALHWQITYQSEDEVVIEPPDGSREAWVAPDILFLKVPEDKAVKNRLHLDLRPTDQAAEVERLIGLGATRADVGQTSSVSWVVLADPEGNEFCVLRAFNDEERADMPWDPFNP